MSVKDRTHESQVEPWMDTIDLGSEHCYLWLTDERGVIEFHPRADGKPGGCAGTVWFSGDQAKHTLISKAPLTIHPSLVCQNCGSHGWVRDGVWTPA